MGIAVDYKSKISVRVIVLALSFSTFLLIFQNCSKESAQSNTVLPTKQSGWNRNSKNLILNPSHFYVINSELAFNTSDPCAYYDSKNAIWHVYFSSKIESQNLQVIKHATQSSSSQSWTVLPEAALAPNLNSDWDAKSVETCSIIQLQNINADYKNLLFYSGTSSLNGNDRDEYFIGLARSNNFNHFERLPIVNSPKGKEGLLFSITDVFHYNLNITQGILTDPKVLEINGKLMMWFYCAGADSQWNFLDGGICLAESLDGLVWTQKGVLRSLYDHPTKKSLPQQPTVVFNHIKNEFWMWLVIDEDIFSSYGVPGLATGGYHLAKSTNGIDWTYVTNDSEMKTPSDLKITYDFVWDPELKSENFGLANGPEVILLNNTLHLFYSSFSNQNLVSGYPYPFIWGLNKAEKEISF